MKEETKTLRVVLDTNVLISALAFHGETKKIMELAEEKQFQLFLSPFILKELHKNLMGKAGLSAEDTTALLAHVKEQSTFVEPDSKVSVIRAKESDNRILECGLAAQADVIVTGNMKHIRPLGSFKGIKILTPREFMNKYFPVS